MIKNVVHQGTLFRSTHVKLVAQISAAIGELERAVIAETRAGKEELSNARRRSFDARQRLEQIIDHAMTLP